jgi:hypothetical protein
MPNHSSQSPAAQGLAYLMKNPKTNPTTPDGRKGFNAMLNASGLPVSETLKYIGKKSKAPKVNEDDKSKERLAKLESSE